MALPFFALSATAPLVQSWYARGTGRSPFRLYALSNLGSLAGLLAFPLAAEPWLSQGGQALVIFGGFVVFTVCMVRAGSMPFEARGDPPEEKEAGARFRPLWLLGPAAGTVMLLSGTNLLAETIANIPLLWILPLMVYLGTFILWFDSRWVKEGRLVFLGLVMAFSLAILALLLALGRPAPLWSILAVVLVVGTGCMIAHGFTYTLRPSGRHLTAYYLSISLGGAIGGLVVGLGAPRVFDRVYNSPSRSRYAESPPCSGFACAHGR